MRIAIAKVETEFGAKRDDAKAAFELATSVKMKADQVAFDANAELTQLNEKKEATLKYTDLLSKYVN